MPLFDTTYIIDLARGDRGALLKAKGTDEGSFPAALSVLSVHEYLYGVHRRFGRSSRGALEEKLSAALAHISRFELIPFTAAIAETSSALQAELMSLGRLIGINDLYIAATALRFEMPLVTRNLAEFKEVPKLKLEGY